MIRKELIDLLEKNILLCAKMSEKIKRGHEVLDGFTRQQVQLIVKLYINGRVKLKDLAASEFVPAPNLCTAFKRLENDGFVLREVDENDRRNTWYSVKENGARVAKKFINMFHRAIAIMFKEIDSDDEEKLIDAFKSMTEILVKMELKNA